MRAVFAVVTCIQDCQTQLQGHSGRPLQQQTREPLLWPSTCRRILKRFDDEEYMGVVNGVDTEVEMADDQVETGLFFEIL